MSKSDPFAELHQMPIRLLYGPVSAARPAMNSWLAANSEIQTSCPANRSTSANLSLC